MERPKGSYMDPKISDIHASLNSYAPTLRKKGLLDPSALLEEESTSPNTNILSINKG